MNVTLPPELTTFLSAEKIIFSVKSSKAPIDLTSIVNIIIGLIATSVPLLIIYLFNNVLHFTSPSRIPVKELSSLIILIGMMIVSFVYGFNLLLTHLYPIFKDKGGYFVGTPTNLVIYYSGQIQTLPWHIFSGDITVKGDNSKGSLSIKLECEKEIICASHVGKKKMFFLQLHDIPHVYHIEKIFRKKMDEIIAEYDLEDLEDTEE